MHRNSVRARAPASLLLAAFVLAACAGTATPGTGSRTSPAADPDGKVVITVSLTSAGYALAGPNGKTLYILTKDREGSSTCTAGRCAEAWAALEGDAAHIQLGAGVSGTFGTTTWADGTLQITHDGQPLYYFHQDEYVGEAKGQGRGGVWCIAPVAYSRCGPLTAPGESASPGFIAPAPANRASENSDGEY